MSGSRTHIRPRVAGAALLALALSGAIPFANAQTELGTQRVGTASGTFLKIAIDAQGAGTAGAAGSTLSGAAAMFWNPAGLGIAPRREILLATVSYPAEIPIGALAYAQPLGPVGLGLSFVGLRSVMEETDEYHPLGTGRDISYGAWALTVGAAGGLTDKLYFGAAAKFYRESFAPEVGGPAIHTWLIDLGAIYFVGYRDTRISLAMMNFGPDLRPGGTFDSRRGAGDMDYTGFSPPTFFRFGASLTAWETGHFKLTSSLEMGHPADNREALRLGFEALIESLFALRTGYDAAADALKLHGGLGLRVAAAERVFFADYNFSDGGYFGDVHRWALRMQW